MSHHPAYTLAAVCATGGIIGYTRTKSRPSLIAGLAFGALYAFSGYLISQNANHGTELATATSILLLGAMGPRALKTRKPVPIVLGVLGAVGSVYFGKKVWEGVYGV